MAFLLTLIFRNSVIRKFNVPLSYTWRYSERSREPSPLSNLVPERSISGRLLIKTVHLGVVAHKLIDYGVDASIIHTVCSLLTGCIQSVKVGGVISEARTLTCGKNRIKRGPSSFLTSSMTPYNELPRSLEVFDKMRVLDNKADPSLSQKSHS